MIIILICIVIDKVGHVSKQVHYLFELDLDNSLKLIFEQLLKYVDIVGLIQLVILSALGLQLNLDFQA